MLLQCSIRCVMKKLTEHHHMKHAHGSSIKSLSDSASFHPCSYQNNVINNRVHISNHYHKPKLKNRCIYFNYPISCHLCSTSAIFHQYLNRRNCREYNSVSSGNIPTLSVSLMKKTLKSNGISFEDGYTCLTINCPVCMEVGKSSHQQGKVYVNKTTGLFVCHECGYTGEWDTFEKIVLARKGKKSISEKDFESLKNRPIVQQETVNSWNEIQTRTVPLESLPADEQLNILNCFSLPSLPSSVIAQFEVRVDISRSVLYFPLYNVGGHVSGYKILKTSEETVPAAGCSGLLGLRPTKSSKQEAAVLVPSIADALALAGQKMMGQIICLPHGLTSLPLQVLPSLEKYNKLVLWFGNDIGCWDAARNFAKKLDERRCFFVRPMDKQPSPHIALTSGYDLRAIVAAAQPIWHQAITTFGTLRQDVLSELQNNDKVQGVKWKRFPALNRTLKGLRRGEFTVLTGPTGSGKTTFMSEYSLDLAMQGVNTLWGSFEIRNARLARTMLQQMAGIPLHVNLDQFDYWADQFEQLPLYFMTFHGQQSVKVVMEAVEHAAYVHDIAHVIIDNVQFMMGVSEESRHVDRFWKQDAIIACFRTFATKKNCHVTLVIHPRKEREADDLTTSSIFGSAKAAQEADNVLIIQDKRLTSVRGKKYLQVAKNRYSGDLGVMTLDFDKGSLSYGQHKKKPAQSDKQTGESDDSKMNVLSPH